MNKVVQSLYEKMQVSLTEISQVADNELQRAERSCETVQNILEELKNYILGYNFQDKEEEIHFFKTVKPGFLSELIYNSERYYLEQNRPVGNEKQQKHYWQKSLNGIQEFFVRNQVFYSYYRTGKTQLDDVFFLRQVATQEFLPVPEYLPDVDVRFSTVHSTKLSQIQAFERLVEYISDQLSLLDNPQQTTSGTANSFTWTDTKAGLIELIYALQSIGAINHSKVDVRQIANLFEQVFHISLGNYYRTFQEIRIRKKGRTAFLDKLREMLLKRMDETDEYFR